jgi:putative tryptophan/tyrosine transport system substrate-binding protein
MAIPILRREFIATLGGAAVGWPFAACAQRAGRLPVIGFLGADTPLTTGRWVAAFVQRLHELGWSEGHTISIEYRWAEGRSERFPQIAAEFVRGKVAVIVTVGTAAAIAAKQATSIIPIVFVKVGDPVGTGLVASLARPGGNVTGVSIQATDTVAKRLKLLREIIPDLGRLAILANLGNPSAVSHTAEVQAAAHALGFEVALFEIRRTEDVVRAIESLRGGADALYVVTDPLLTTNRIQINTLALDARLPTVHTSRDYVETGLFSYGPSVSDQYQRVADYVDKILHGTKAGDIPVGQTTKFNLVINLTTAKTLGLTMPDNLLALADEVIE